MSLLGKAAVAMWWSVRPEQRSEFSDWHSHEHFPERMSIPGFRRGSRWSSTTDAEGFFVLYELERYEVLTSQEYLDRLNAPTPWSRKMMPHHLGMVRSQCRIIASFGGGVAASLATLRLSPQAGRAAELQAHLLDTLGALASNTGTDGRSPPADRYTEDGFAHHGTADPGKGRRRRLDRAAVGLRRRCRRACRDRAVGVLGA
ncbi:hypothetical protein ACVMFA_000980 [Bradyrhizobium liaoningense]